MVRLAHAQGYLTRPSLNPIQLWALQYFMRMERRQYVKDKDDEIEAQCYNIAGYERWKHIYDSGGQGGDMGQAFDGEEEQAITDPGDLDRWFNRIANQNGMTGQEAETAIRQGNPLLGPGWEGGMKV